LSGIKEKAGRIGRAGGYASYDVRRLHEQEGTAFVLVVCLDRESSTVMLAPQSGGIEPGTLREKNRRDAL